MDNNFVDSVVIGGGVIGLAIARKLALNGREVIIIEEESNFGTVTSSRNSGVIHAGVYYEKSSLRAKLCTKGKEAMYVYCKTHNIPHINTGKFIVATSNNEINKLDEIFNQALSAGVVNIERVSKEFIQKEEPLINCVEGLYVGDSGIIDSSALMRSYLGEIEEKGGVIAVNSKFLNAESKKNQFLINIQSGEEKIKISSNILINSAGLRAEMVAKGFQFFDPLKIPKTYFAKGNYFETRKKLDIKHLIYPIPNNASLGIHLGLDMGMQVKFGPDVEWIDEIKYDVDSDRLNLFYEEIRKYMPSINKEILRPGYSGIRPKLKNKGEGKSDFLIQGAEDHGIKNLINLFGIESPGLTSSLAIGDYVYEMVT